MHGMYYISYHGFLIIIGNFFEGKMYQVMDQLVGLIAHANLPDNMAKFPNRKGNSDYIL